MTGHFNSAPRDHVKRRDWWFELSIIWFVLLLAAGMWYLLA